MNQVETVLTGTDELVSDEWDSMLCVAKWHCNYRYAVENVMDPMHGAYLHAESHSMADGDKKTKFASRQTDTGFVFEKIGQRDVNFDWVEWGETGAIWMRLEIPYQQSAGPGGNFGIIGMATPVAVGSAGRSAIDAPSASRPRAAATA